MTVQVIILRGAEADLRELRRYLRHRFGSATWNDSFAAIKQAIARIADHPQAGTLPEELEALQLDQYRQVLSGKNRIVYETRGERIFVHLVCDVRRDLRDVLLRRLVQAQ